MSCLRQSVSFHSIAQETGLQGLFLALPISKEGTILTPDPCRVPRNPGGHRSPIIAMSPVHPSLPAWDHAATHHDPTQLNYDSSHYTMQIPRPSSSYAAKSHSKLRSGVTNAFLLMHCRGRSTRHGVSSISLPPEGRLQGHTVHPFGESGWTKPIYSKRGC